MPPRLQTDHLTLRTHGPDDAEPMFELARDRRVADATASLPHPYERHMADAFIADRTRALLLESVGLADRGIEVDRPADHHPVRHWRPTPGGAAPG